MQTRMGYEVMCDLEKPINSYGQLIGQELCRVRKRSELERCEIGRTRHEVECKVEHLVKFHRLDLIDLSHVPSM